VKLLHPTDFSECADQALSEAVRLARCLGAELVLLHVPVEAALYGEGLMGSREVRQVYEAERKWATDTLEARAAELRESGLAARGRVVPGIPFEEIVRAAGEETADVIVIGTHGRGRLSRFLLGSVADRVIRLAPCPVLTVRTATRQGGQ
jgi:nucleotide-binding universal stress UspA family protein